MPVIYYPDQGPRHLQDERKWSYLVKLPGVRSGMKIPVSCRLIVCKHQMVTPRRVRVNAEIDLSSPEVRVAHESGPQIRWKTNPESIPAVSAVVAINHVINIPKDLPAILQVEDFQASVRIEHVTILRDRLVVKGDLIMQTVYSIRA